MTCPHISESVANHFEKMLSPAARLKHEQHLSDCHQCRQQLAAFGGIPQILGQWQTQSVPEWDRAGIMRPAAARKTLPQRVAVTGGIVRWAPLAASLVLAVAVLAQTRIEVTDAGWSLSFGGHSGALDSAELADYLAQHAEMQQTQTRQWVEAALRVHGETTADSVYQWMTWMEQQRDQDVQRMEAGFQQLLDRDFQTVDSMRQLASYVMYQETP